MLPSGATVVFVSIASLNHTTRPTGLLMIKHGPLDFKLAGVNKRLGPASWGETLLCGRGIFAGKTF